MKAKQDSVTLLVIFTVSGIVAGALFRYSFSPIFGGILGYLFASNLILYRRVLNLEKRSFRSEDVAAEDVSTESTTSVAGVASQDDMAAEPLAFPATEIQVEDHDTLQAEEDHQDDVDDLAQPPVRETEPVPPRRVGAGVETSEKFFTLLKDFFTTGNVILKIGLIVLFFGISFLLKYAAQRNLIPIEFRLAGVAMGGLSLLAVGWALRRRKPLYGLTLQGGGIGILYLTVFASAKLYHLLPFVLAFGVMLCLVALAGMLAVLQDEKWLAIAGSVGGFLAPVLLSTGGGSHVALFSYYLLLNLGILGIAWFKTWRPLNLIGFVFTYVIGAVWGGRYYQPTFFASVEPFLLVSFLLYTLVSILFALKLPLNLKGYIDSPLVFGVPIITFAMQYGLVQNLPNGLAVSSVGFGVFYMFAAVFLWRRYQVMRMLVEVYLSFAVVFGSLAIPLALDGNWITAAWAMEGAALVWVGVRQRRLRARIFGVLLQLGAGLSFLDALPSVSGGWAVLNGTFLSCLLLAVSALFSSWYFDNSRGIVREWEGKMAVPLLILGLIWWFGGGIREIDHFGRYADKAHLLLVFIAVSCTVMAFAARKIPWPRLGFAPIGLLPVMILLSLIPSGLGWQRQHLFAGWGAISWFTAVSIQYRLLYSCGQEWPAKVVSLFHQLSLWLLVFIFCRESHWLVRQSLPFGVWGFLPLGAVPAAALGLTLGPARKLAWPVGRFHLEYLNSGPAAIVIYLFFWGFFAVTLVGDPDPLPYLPLFNPLEILQVLCFLTCLRWALDRRAWLRDSLHPDMNRLLIWLPGLLLFLWLNATVARTVHFSTAVPYALPSLLRSNVFEAAISILWSLTALPVMLFSTRKHNRQLWMAGAGLLLLVVLKLFVVDLSGIGTIARIVSFLVVGLLMLLIGYFSPMPPKKEETA